MELLAFTASVPKGEDKAMEYLFDWSQKNLRYERQGTTSQKPLNSLAVFRLRTGNCIEQSVFLSTCLLLSGVDAWIENVDVDEDGEQVDHACVLVRRKNGFIQLIDPAYHQINARHKVYQEVSQEWLVNYFNTEEFAQPQPEPERPNSVIDFLRELF